MDIGDILCIKNSKNQPYSQICYVLFHHYSVQQNSALICLQFLFSNSKYSLIILLQRAMNVFTVTYPTPEGLPSGPLNISTQTSAPTAKHIDQTNLKCSNTTWKIKIKPTTNEKQLYNATKMCQQTSYLIYADTQSSLSPTPAKLRHHVLYKIFN